jgi:hypothetical protein
MNDEPFYPTIKDEVVLPLKVALQHAKTNPAYLDNGACPYPDLTKNFIRSLVSMSGVGITDGSSVDMTFLDPTSDGLDVMLKELDRLYTDLKSFRNTLNTMEPNEKAIFFKTTMALLEKIATIKERTYNMKTVSDFQQAVITAMTDELDEETQKRVIAALDKKVMG